MAEIFKRTFVHQFFDQLLKLKPPQSPSKSKPTWYFLGLRNSISHELLDENPLPDQYTPWIMLFIRIGVNILLSKEVPVNKLLESALTIAVNELGESDRQKNSIQASR